MNMNIQHLIAAAAILLSAVSCDDRKVFDQEQYKNIFGFVSESDNTKEKVVSLHYDSVETYMSFSMGGSLAPERDVKIEIAEDPDLIKEYNFNNYDTDVSKYSVALPAKNYSISNSTCTIKAGTRLGIIPVTIYPKGLSPDEDYIIPVRVHSYDGGEMHPDKSTLLLQVGIKNQWANSNGVAYSMVATRKELPNGSPINMPGNKTVHCWEANSVRTTPGNLLYSASIHDQEMNCIILEVATTADAAGYRKVTIRPLRDMKVEQLDGDKDYPNAYAIIDDGFNTYKTFLLHYNYTVGKSTYEVKEELRVKYEEDKDVDEGFDIVKVEH